MRAALACLGLLLVAAGAFFVLRNSERDGAALGQSAAGGTTAAPSPAAEELLAPAAPPGSPPQVAGPGAAGAEAPASEGAVRRDATAAQAAASGEGTLFLRLLDAQLAALPKTAVEIEAVWEGGRSSWISRSDAEARLRLVLPQERRPELPHTLYLHGRDQLKGLGARLALLPGAADLGDVALQPEPVLVSGVVLSPNAHPLDRPWVEVRPLGASGLERATLRAATAQDRSFEVRTWAEDAAWLELTAKSTRTCAVHRRVAPGAAGVVLQLETGGTIAGRVLLDEREHAKRLSCALASGTGDWMRVPLEDAGALTPLRLQPGRYSLRLVLEGHPLPLLALEGIDVANDAVVTPPELDPCDLRGRLREIAVEARDDQSRELFPRFRFRAAGAEAWSEYEQDMRHRGMRLLAQGALDVEASLPGYHTAVLYGVESDATIQLERAHPIAICLSAAPSLPAGCSLEVRLQRADGAAAEPRWPVKFGGHCARHTTAVAGSYLAVIDLVRLPEVAIGSDLPHEVLATCVQPLVVLDVAHEQDFAVTLDQAWIDAGLAKPSPYTFR